MKYLKAFLSFMAVFIVIYLAMSIAAGGFNFQAWDKQYREFAGVMIFLSGLSIIVVRFILNETEKI